MKGFTDPDALPSTWYAVLPSRALPRGGVAKATLHDRTLALFRGEDGRAHALDSRCPHLGADLSRGRVVDGRLRCEFHHWSFDGDGRCRHVPGEPSIPAFAKVFRYPVEERYGFVWVFNGREPTFPVPGFEGWPEARVARIATFETPFNCHTHVACSNGLDVAHMQALHGMVHREPPEVRTLDPFRVQARYRMSLGGTTAKDRLARALIGDVVDLTYTTWGGNTAVTEVRHDRFPMLMMFNFVPQPGGKTLSRQLYFLPKTLGEHPNYLMYPWTFFLAEHFLAPDQPLLDSLRFWPRLTPQDEGLRQFITQVNGLPAFDPPGGRVVRAAGTD